MMKHKKNKALKKKISRYTQRVGRQKIFHTHRQIKKILGILCILCAATIAVFPLYALLLVGIGLLFLRGPLYTERKVMRVVHTIRRIKKIVKKYVQHLFHTRS